MTNFVQDMICNLPAIGIHKQPIFFLVYNLTNCQINNEHYVSILQEQLYVALLFHGSVVQHSTSFYSLR